MSKPNKCPPHLRLVVDRVADYVGRHHHGLNANELLRVDIYARQTKKDRATTLNILEGAGIITLTPLGKGESWVRHTKHKVNPPTVIVKEDPEESPATAKCTCCGKEKAWDEYPDAREAGEKHPICTRCTNQINDHRASNTKLCHSCGRTKAVSEFRALPGGGTTANCNECLDRLTKVAQPKEQAMNQLENLTPEAMRKLAEQLQKQAEEKEREGKDRAAFNKALQPLVAELVKSHGMASRKFDEYIDAMAELGKAVDRLRDFKGE